MGKKASSENISTPMIQTIQLFPSEDCEIYVLGYSHSNNCTKEVCAFILGIFLYIQSHPISH